MTEACVCVCELHMNECIRCNCVCAEQANARTPDTLLCMAHRRWTFMNVFFYCWCCCCCCSVLCPGIGNYRKPWIHVFVLGTASGHQQQIRFYLIVCLSVSSYRNILMFAQLNFLLSFVAQMAFENAHSQPILIINEYCYLCATNKN